MGLNLSDLPSDVIKIIASYSSPMALKRVNVRLNSIINNWLSIVNNKIGQFCETDSFRHEPPLVCFIRRCHQLRGRAKWLEAPIIAPFNAEEDFKNYEANLSKLKAVQEIIKEQDFAAFVKTVSHQLFLEQVSDDPHILWQALKAHRCFHAIQHLHLFNMKLRFLPDEIGELTKLRKLNVSMNKLHTLPKEIGHLKKLRHLLLNSNELVFLPEEIGRMSRLKKMHLHCNQLCRVPYSIVQLNELKELILTSNKISNLPELFSELKQLRILNIDNNQFTDIPNEILFLPALEELSLHGNRVQELPTRIKQMPQLKLISISYNCIRQFPQELENNLHFRLVGRYAQHPLPF